MRDSFARGFAGIPTSPKSPTARSLTIPGQGVDIPLRVVAPADVRGVYLHLHGGGWIVGTNDMWDDQFERLGREAGLACVSVAYRLAPEHVFPAALDDCVAAAIWLIERAKPEFRASWLAIGGESAGAHLSVATLLRLRADGLGAAFGAANLLYGIYDLSLTPSARRAEGTPIIDRAAREGFTAAFRGNIDERDPAISPLYADLADLPPWASRARSPSRGRSTPRRELIVHTSTTKCCTDFIAQLALLDSRCSPQPGRTAELVVLVFDNGPIHTSKATTAAIAAHPWLTVEWLPRNAPELNDIELTWREFKRHHLAHRTFEDAANLDNAIHEAAQNLSAERQTHHSCDRLRIAA